MSRALQGVIVSMVLVLAFVMWPRDSGPVEVVQAGPSLERPVLASDAAIGDPVSAVQLKRVEMPLAEPSAVVDRIDAEVPDDHWRTVAKQHVADTMCIVRGDAFHEVLLKMLQGAAEKDEEVVRLGNGANTLLDAEEAEKNSNLNPTGLKLSDGDRARLNDLIREFNEKMRFAERDLNLTHKMCTSKCLLRGDFLSYPAGTENINKRVTDDSKSEFENPLDMNHICLPAANGMIRAVVLKAATSPEYFEVLKSKRSLEAEHAIAVRMFFYPTRR